MTKVPLDPESGSYASTADPATWTAFETAVDHRDSLDADGIGFVFTEADAYIGVDLDDCRDPDTGYADAWAAEIIARLDSYTEVSPSGTGYHVIARGTLPGDRSRHGAIEMYEANRFFTMTGDHVAGTPQTVAQRTAELTHVYRDYLQSASESSSSGPADAESPASSPETLASDEKLLERARAAANGDDFAQLWDGNAVGYESHSEADMALCCHLAFWTGGDPARMDRLFRDSGLMRSKWDEVHYADGSTYGERTIERALTVVDEVYNPTSR